MRKITRLDYVNNADRLGAHVTVRLPNGDIFEGIILSFINVPGLETVTIGYGGLASELRQRDEALPLQLHCKHCRGERLSVQRSGTVICGQCGEKQ